MLHCTLRRDCWETLLRRRLYCVVTVFEGSAATTVERRTKTCVLDDFTLCPEYQNSLSTLAWTLGLSATTVAVLCCFAVRVATVILLVRQL